MALHKKFEHLKIKLEDIKLATNNFADGNCIGRGGFGKVYKGELIHSKGHTVVALKQLNRRLGQGDPEFWKEIILLSLYKHENLVSLLGFCDDGGEKILVYQYASKSSLDKHLKSNDLTWVRRLNICIGAARGLAYLHNYGTTQQRVLHRDIKSSNILLDENWNARISDFGLSKLGPANQQITFLVSGPVGTLGYCDPQYIETGLLTKESDVYSFGVVLFEVLCGKLCTEDNPKSPHSFTRSVQRSYEQKTVNEIIFSDMRNEVNPHSLDTFTTIAYQCLNMDSDKRPLMSEVVRDLEKALRYQISGDDPLIDSIIQENKHDMSIGELLDIEPHDLQFPFELMKKTSISMRLKNKTDTHVAFKVKTTKPKTYAALPNTGILSPHSSCDIILRMQAQKEAPLDMQCNDKFLLQSTVVTPGIAPTDITRELFNEESGNQVKKCILNVNYFVPSQPLPPIRENSEEDFFTSASISDDGTVSYDKSLCDDLIQEKNNDISTGELLSIEPHELQFPFELKKEISITRQLKNKIDSYVAFKVKTTKPNEYGALPTTGILLPRSTCNVTFTIQAQNEAPHGMRCDDKYLLQSAVISPGVTLKDITRELFNKESGNQVEECELEVNYVSPLQPSSQVQEVQKKALSKRGNIRYIDYIDYPVAHAESNQKSSS